MGLTKLKNKVLSKFNGSSLPPSTHGTPGITIDSKTSATQSQDPYLSYQASSSATANNPSAAQPQLQPPSYAQSWEPWMPKEPIATTPVNPSNVEGQSKTSGDEPTQAEQKLMTKLLMSDEEKEKQAEERRKYVKEYLRNNRDTNNYMMGAYPEVF